MNQNTSSVASKYSSGEYCLDWIMVKQAWSFFFQLQPGACGIWIPWPGMEAWSLNCWTAREVPRMALLIIVDFSFSISPSVNIQGWSPLRLTDLILQYKGLLGVFSSITVQRHQFLGVLPNLQSKSHNHYQQSSVSLFKSSLGLSSLSCQEAIVFWFHGCSQHLQWFWSPRRGNMSLLPPFLLLFAMQSWGQMPWS